MRRLVPLFFLLSLLLALSCRAASAQTFPEPQGYVSDFAGLLSAQTKSRLADQLTRIEKETTSEVAVVTIKTLDGLTVEDYGVRLFEKWGVGKKSKDNGVLFLVAEKERKVRIEVGYGLEAVITDARVGRILDNDVVPHLRRNDWDAGISGGVDAIEAYVRGGVPAQAENDGDGASGFLEGVGGMLFLVFGLIFLSYVVSFMARTRSYWLGGVLGGLSGLGLGLVFGGVIGMIIGGVGLGGLGTGFDWILSRNYQRQKQSGRSTTWHRTWGGFGGGGGRSGGGFGGFGGGGSGGGGGSRGF